MKPRSVKSIELVISLVLQIGVVVSSGIILIGLVLFFYQHGQTKSPLNVPDYHRYTSASYFFPHSFKAMKASLRAGQGIGLMTLGILLLVLTPILRVSTSILLFLRQRDRPMTLVTLVVLLVLAGSFFLGVAIQ